MRVELTRFKVNKDKSARVDEWLKMLNENMGDVVQTLEREQMKLEVIFREVMGDAEYLYWFSVQGEAGEDVNTSTFEVDRKHIAFHDECIDHGYGAHDAQPQVVMVPHKVAAAMDWDNPSADVVPFERRELIHYRPE
ncbi:MAG: hypothetical protein JNK32_11665 [Anaerolineales bacterium]|nr:hypothetical protein [Anaerolineales bacterium]